MHGKDLARFIFEQMKQHYSETPTDYNATVARGFQLLASPVIQRAEQSVSSGFPAASGASRRYAKNVFGGFQRCCYPHQRFQSNEERELAVVVDSTNEKAVLRR